MKNNVWFKLLSNMGKIEFFKELFKGDVEKSMFITKTIMNEKEMKKVSQRRKEIALILSKEVNVYEIKNDSCSKIGKGTLMNNGIRVNRRPNIQLSDGNLLFGEHSVISEYRNYTEGICVEICVIFERNDWYYKRWYKIISKSW